MNLAYLSKQMYRVRIAGAWRFSVDAYQVLRQSRNRRVLDRVFPVVGDHKGPLRILYIHSGWAIRNVGLLWFGQAVGARCTLASIEQFLSEPSIQAEHDIVFFGYSELLLKWHALVSNRLIWCAVHDPREIFPERPDWASLSPDVNTLSMLRRVDRLFVTSLEMHQQLRKFGFECITLPTDSCLPIRPVVELAIQPGRALRIITVGRIYRRKHLEMFQEIKNAACKKFGRRIEFGWKVGYVPIPEDEYIRLLDTRDVYICTSFQEGGPIPPMDAMCRGELVLSTPVGQMPQRIRDGHNGCLCRTATEFVDQLGHLVDSPSLVLNMKKNAITTSHQFRTEGTVGEAVRSALRLSL